MPMAMNLPLTPDPVLPLSLSDVLGLLEPPPGFEGGGAGLLGAGLVLGGLNPPPGAGGGPPTPPPKPPPPPKPRLLPLMYVVPQQVTEAGAKVPRPTSRPHFGHDQIFSKRGVPPVIDPPVMLPLKLPLKLPLIDPPVKVVGRPEIEPVIDPPVMVLGIPPGRPEMDPLNDPPEMPRPEIPPEMPRPEMPPEMPRPGCAWTGRAISKAIGNARITAEVLPRVVAPFIGVPLLKYADSDCYGVRTS